ncbi:MAG: stage II sporulation protein M [Candidatus Nanosalina sp.]
MLEEVFLIEEERQNFGALAFLGLVSGITGYFLARFMFPTEAGLLAVFFAAVPMIYSLAEKFLDDEKENRPHIPEVESYLSIFVGELAAFFLLGLKYDSGFEIQRKVVGISGAAVSQASFSMILFNNLAVFLSILFLAVLLGSAGAFILTWNASVLGVFLAGVFRSTPLNVLAYLPHALFEMTGFIIAGVAGSLMSAAIYRRHMDRDTWSDYIRLAGLGVLCIFIGAFLETA